MFHLATAFLVFAATFSRPMERVTSLDPAQARSIYDAHAIGLLYEMPLAIDYKARPYRIIPGFCELPEVSSDGLVYTFRVAHTNATLAAQDVVRSLESLRDPGVVSPNGWILKDVDTISAPDARTVVVTLKRRCHFFPWLMTMPATAVRRPARLGTDPFLSCAGGASRPLGTDPICDIGTGPYLLRSWRKNHEMVFERRPGFAAGSPTKTKSSAVGASSPTRGFDTIRYLVIDDVSTQWLMFLKGEIDFLGEISRDNWDSIVGANGRLDPRLEAQGVKLHSIAAIDVLYVGLNMRDPVLGPNRKLRQALNAAFDGEAWEKFYNGRIQRGDGPVPPGIAGRLTTPFQYAYDLEKAKRLLAEAGYPGGIDPKTGRRLVLTLSIGRASQESRESAELMASFYERIGIKMESDFKTWDAFLKATGEGRVQMFRMGWVGDYPDAQNFLQLFYSKNLAPGPNRSAYVNAAFDREYEAALAATTDAERNERWLRCQEILREDCPWIFTHYNKAYSLTRSNVGNYVPTDFPYGVEQFYENVVP